VRPKPGAPVSTPLRWEELTPDVRPAQFTMPVVLRRVAGVGDLYEAVLTDKRSLKSAAAKLARSVP
jgi:bifunctional non-homologous end joining protein LigD